jgi:hypothetical protein
LGQISLPVVNRTGIYSHWAGSSDNVYNYSKLLKQNMFISLLLSLFFKKKFFIYNNLKISELKNLLEEPKDKKNIESNYEESKYVDLVKLAVDNVSLELPLYAGKILFLKQRGVLITLVFFFQPPKGDFKKKKTEKKKMQQHLTIKGHLVYQSKLSSHNPLFFNKYNF